MNRCGAAALPLAVAVQLAACTLGGQQATAMEMECRVQAPGVQVPELLEGSGVAASRRVPGRLWAHNDSGDPVLYALDESGAVAGRLQLRGASVEDWEAIASGPCPAGSCLYVGDIGDNDAERSHVTIYRLPEPEDPGGRAAVEAFHARYPDGPQDAEALLLTPDGDLFIVTKGETGPVGLYRFPPKLQPGTTVTLEQVGRSRDRDAVDREDRITDGAVSPDGAWIALRTRERLHIHDAARFLSGDWNELERFGLDDLDEPQGEGVTFATETTLVLLSEGGGKKRPGLLSRMTCTMSQAGD